MCRLRYPVGTYFNISSFSGFRITSSKIMKLEKRSIPGFRVTSDPFKGLRMLDKASGVAPPSAVPPFWSYRNDDNRFFAPDRSTCPKDSRTGNRITLKLSSFPRRLQLVSSTSSKILSKSVNTLDRHMTPNPKLETPKPRTNLKRQISAHLSSRQCGLGWAVAWPMCFSVLLRTAPSGEPGSPPLLVSRRLVFYWDAAGAAWAGSDLRTRQPETECGLVRGFRGLG